MGERRIKNEKGLSPLEYPGNIHHALAHAPPRAFAARTPAYRGGMHRRARTRRGALPGAKFTVLDRRESRSGRIICTALLILNIAPLRLFPTAASCQRENHELSCQSGKVGIPRQR